MPGRWTWKFSTSCWKTWILERYQLPCPVFATGKANDKPNGYPLPGPVRINCEFGTNLATIFCCFLAMLEITRVSNCTMVWFLSMNQGSMDKIHGNSSTWLSFLENHLGVVGVISKASCITQECVDSSVTLQHQQPKSLIFCSRNPQVTLPPSSFTSKSCESRVVMLLETYPAKWIYRCLVPGGGISGSSGR